MVPENSGYFLKEDLKRRRSQSAAPKRPNPFRLRSGGLIGVRVFANACEKFGFEGMCSQNGAPSTSLIPARWFAAAPKNIRKAFLGFVQGPFPMSINFSVATHRSQLVVAPNTGKPLSRLKPCSHSLQPPLALVNVKTLHKSLEVFPKSTPGLVLNRRGF